MWYFSFVRVWYLSVIQYQGTKHVCDLFPLCVCDICPLYNTEVQQIRVWSFSVVRVISVRYTIPRYNTRVWSFSVVRVWYLSVIQYRGTRDKCDRPPPCNTTAEHTCGLWTLYSNMVQHVSVCVCVCVYVRARVCVCVCVRACVRVCVIFLRHTIARHNARVWFFFPLYNSKVQHTCVWVIFLRHTIVRHNTRVWFFRYTISRYNTRVCVWYHSVIQ